MPKISVIIPVYNPGKYFRKCLKSIQDQSFTDFEVILIDDCSTDGSLALAQEFAREDARFKVLRNDKNSGQGVSRDRGTAEARGEYVVYIDSDDRVKKNLLQCQYDAALKYHADIVWNAFLIEHRWTTCDVDTHPPRAIVATGMEHLYSEFCGIDAPRILPAIGRPWLTKRTLIIDNQLKHPPGRRWGEDMEFGFKCIAMAQTVVSLPERCYIYNMRNANSITKKVNLDCAISIFESMTHVRQFLEMHNLFPEALEKRYYENAERNLIHLLMDCDVLLDDFANLEHLYSRLQQIDPKFLKLTGTAPLSVLASQIISAVPEKDLAHTRNALKQLHFRAWKQRVIPAQFTRAWHRIKHLLKGKR